MNVLVRLCLAPVMFCLFAALVGVFLIACGISVWQWGTNRLRRRPA